MFEDISTFDAENPIVGSLLRETDIKKKQSDSDFIKYFPSHPGKEFEIQKVLARLKGKSGRNNNNNNNNNNNSSNRGTNTNLYGLDQPRPSLLTLEDFIDDGASLPPQPPSAPINNLFNNASIRPPGSIFNVENTTTAPNFPLPGNNLFGSQGATVAKTNTGFLPDNTPTVPDFSMPGIVNNLSGSEAASLVKENKTKTQQEVDDFLYELPDTGMPDLVQSDGLIQTLGTEAEDLFDNNTPPTKNEEEDEILKELMDQYKVNEIKDTMDESSQIRESIYFFYGGDSQAFVDALEFVGLSPLNREFAAFLLSELGRQTMTQNKLSIHGESGDIFYDNHNTGENFYRFFYRSCICAKKVFISK